MALYPPEPNMHSSNVFRCLLTSSDGIIMDMDLLLVCLERFKVNLNDEEVKQWFLMHQSTNFGMFSMVAFRLNDVVESEKELLL